MAARPDSLEQAQMQAVGAVSAFECMDDKAGSSKDHGARAGSSNDRACDDDSSWRAYRTTADEATWNDDADDCQEGPAPPQWLAKGWIDYSKYRVRPYPGEDPWWGWVTYDEEEFQAWEENPVEKAVRLAERDDDGDESPSVRAPFPKKVKAPSSPISIPPSEMLVDVADLFHNLNV